MRLCIVIVNQRTPGQVLDVLGSLDGQVDPVTDQVVVVDNDSRDDSVPRIDAAIAQRGFGAWCTLVRAPRNAGLAAANNVGIRAADADYYLLLHSETLVRPGAIAALLSELRAHPGVGIAGPRLEAFDGTALPSCFRDHTPVSELLSAARTRPISAVLRRYEVPLPVSDDAQEVDWISFACVLLRRDVIEKVGLLDEGYFMYFEDSDYCRAARAVGFRVRYFPHARVAFARGAGMGKLPGPAPRRRGPRAFYASRTRYFRKGYGPLGPWVANACWQLGRSVSLSRELAGRRAGHTCQRQWLDNWIDSFKL
jgi:N-acetylglucosaminyl-diphospho-decaprenol L-rhamnosyltransferase